MSARTTVAKVLSPFNLAITRRSSLQELHRQFSELEQEHKALRGSYFVSLHSEDIRARLTELLPSSCAQIMQDLFVLAQLGFKRNGYFVEFGACDGVKGSNTLLLEREYGWRGILAEPARIWHERLRENRNAAISTRCVWSRSGETVTFNETDLPALSTINSFSDTDHWAEERSNGRTYSVDTISLNDLLAESGAPREIDYISIDTEGSELEILRAFDFSKYHVSAVTCEHNYTPAREAIHALLTQRGFVRKCEMLSQFDDWYVAEEELRR